MKSTVDFHSGPDMIALAIRPAQSSPAVIEAPLCSLKGAVGSTGTTREKLGRFPFLAASAKSALMTLWLPWLVYRHSAMEGQVSQMYPRVGFPLVAGCGSP